MADTALLRLSLAEAAERIRRRALSPVELTEAVLAQIDALNPSLNAFTTLAPRGQVLAAARAAESEIAAGTYRGVLHGIPVSVKDLIDTAGLRTTYGSGMFRDHVPAKDGGVPERRARVSGRVGRRRASTGAHAARLRSARVPLLECGGEPPQHRPSPRRTRCRKRPTPTPSC